MNARQIEVCRHYKAIYPEAFVLYHFPGQFIVLGDDTERASEIIPTIQLLESDVGSFPDTSATISALSGNGDEVVIVRYRNDCRQLDYPDFMGLKSEKEMDF